LALPTTGRFSPIDLGEYVRALIVGRDTALGALSTDERSGLRELYQPDNALLWLDATGQPTQKLQGAVTVLSKASDDGLDPADYYQDLIARLTRGPKPASSTVQDLSRLDVAVSAGILRYLRDVHMGRVDPRTIGFRLDAPRDRHDFAALLRSAIAERRVTQLAVDLRPPLAQYHLLRDMLPRYRMLAADPTLLALRSISHAIHPGELYGDVDALRQALIALGDMPAEAPVRQPGRYEGAAVDGVKRFQVRHGLESDGVLGKSTIAALRVPLTWRARQIELALERLRWLPHLGDQRLIALNIPMFRLWAWDMIPPSGLPLFGMDVIVGRALSTQTPVFAEEMREVIFRPYWNVPRSILQHEVLPKIERDPEYLRREDMEIVRGAGDNAPRVEVSADALAGLRRGDLRVRQRPGQKNALGLVKFVFPNNENVYMHGTPAQALFAKSRRDFSHGCVRVAYPIALAKWVLQDRPEWTRDRILSATMGTQTLHVKLPRPIQVILFYTTAAVMPEDGTIRFAEDIYRHDARLDRALDTLHHIRTRPVSTWTKSDAG
jgi:murein L,D-transpeptidase YcbB/YkuD